MSPTDDLLVIEREADDLLNVDAKRSLSDTISWHAQGLIRKWRFILLIQAVIFVWLNRWGPFHFDDGAHSQLNIFMSDWALWIESIVGVGMFAQTLRDSKVLRFLVLMLKMIVRVSRRLEDLMEQQANQEEAILRLEQQILKKLDQ